MYFSGSMLTIVQQCNNNILVNYIFCFNIRFVNHYYIYLYIIVQGFTYDYTIFVMVYNYIILHMILHICVR